MYHPILHQQVNAAMQAEKIDIAGEDNLFYTRFIANASSIDALFREIYGPGTETDFFLQALITAIVKAYRKRSPALLRRDDEKIRKGNWFLSQEITGMSLYVDRFCGSLAELTAKIDYFKKLGVNFLHLMPVFESPAGESDGGYAVSDFRKVDTRFGTLRDLMHLQDKMQQEDMYLMLDIVLNHTSHHHAWAEKARQGDKRYQDYYNT